MSRLAKTVRTFRRRLTLVAMLCVMAFAAFGPGVGTANAMTVPCGTCPVAPAAAYPNGASIRGTDGAWGNIYCSSLGQYGSAWYCYTYQYQNNPYYGPIQRWGQYVYNSQYGNKYFSPMGGWTVTPCAGDQSCWKRNGGG